MTDDLKAKILKAAETLKEYGAKEVYLFGSAAAGTMREDSDVDLAVKGLPPEVFYSATGRAGRALKENLDVIDLDEDNPFTRYLKRENELVRVL
jgi:predicted nucleotidyltransferase